MNSNKAMAIILTIIGTLLITIGATYSLFSYSKEGLTENTIESGSIRFHYQEGNRSISITDAMPMTDAQGKEQDKYFDFTITSKTSSEIKVPYYITARRKGNDSSLDSAVRLYLTEVTNKGEQNEGETPLTLENNQQVSKFSQLSTYTNTTLNITAAKNEKVLYTAEVPKNTNNYTKDYRLRMWVDDSATYSQTETGTCSDPTYTTKSDCQTAGEDWTVTATAEQKTFTVTVNVYAEGESAVARTKLKDLVLARNTVTPTTSTVPDFEKSSSEDSAPAGLYSMNVTNGFGGQSAEGTTYYFRGNIDSNKVKFAGKDWRIIRINEDGTVRLILDGSTDESNHVFNSDYSNGTMYYSDSEIKSELEQWYSNNITGNDAAKVASGNYFCEAGKTKSSAGSATNAGATGMVVSYRYTPDLTCVTDTNNKGLIQGNPSVGFINFDEAVLAGLYEEHDSDSYLIADYIYLTMSPGGYNYAPYVWRIYSSGHLDCGFIMNNDARMRPVINLLADTEATYNEVTGFYEVQ